MYEIVIIYAEAWFKCPAANEVTYNDFILKKI